MLIAILVITLIILGLVAAINGKLIGSDEPAFNDDWYKESKTSYTFSQKRGDSAKTQKRDKNGRFA